MTSVAPGLDEQRSAIRPSPANGWAIVLLVVFALINGLALALLVFAGAAVGAGFRILTAIGVAGLVATSLIVAVGLAQDRRWARPAAVGFLWILVISGAVDVVAGLGAGRFTVPLIAIAALLILRSWRGSAVPPDAAMGPLSSLHRSIAAIAVAVFVVVTLVWPAMLTWLAVPGNSPLAVTASAVAVDATLDCRAFSAAAADPAGDASQVPIPATVAWRWSQHEFLPGGTDSLAIRWTMAMPDGSDAGPSSIYLADAPGYHSDGSSSWLNGSPGGPFTTGLSTSFTTLADQLATGHGADATDTGFPVAIDVAEQLLRDDQFSFSLRDSLQPPDHGTLTVEGFYVHQDKWSAGPGTASCSW
jgi:hypothetical protein